MLRRARATGAGRTRSAVAPGWVALGLVAALAGCGSGADSAGAGAAAPEVRADALVTTAVEETSTTLEETAEPEAATSEVGALVDGFPEDLLPVPDDAVILVTSQETVGDSPMREVSLNFRTGLRVPVLVDLYRDALVDVGFEEVGPRSDLTDLAAELTFVRSSGDELVSIGVLDDGDGRTVTIGGRVRADA